MSVRSEKCRHPKWLLLNLRLDGSAALVVLLLLAVMLWSGAAALGSPGTCRGLLVVGWMGEGSKRGRGP